MGGFGQHLVERGVLSDAQLEEALRFQQVYGGRMGTVVVDLGYLVVEELAEYLSDFAGVPLPPPEWLEAPDPQALKNVPPPVVRRCQALPLSLEGGDLHVVMLDPRDPEKLDFLAMAASRPVVPYVLPERKLLYWLERHCGLDRPPRFLGMVTRPRQIGLTEDEVASGTPVLDTRERIDARAARAANPAPAEEEADDAAADSQADRPAATAVPQAPMPPIARERDVEPAPLPPVRSRAEEAAADAASRSAAEGAPDAAAHAADDATAYEDGDATEEEEEIILLDELVAAPDATTEAWELPEEFEEAEPSPEAAGTDRREPVSLRVARLESRLYQSRNRDEVVGLCLEIARTFSASAALFVVRGDEVSLFRSGIAGAGADELELAVPIRTPSVFTHPAQTGLPFRGQPPEGGIDARVLEGLGRGGVQEILVHPVVIRDRVVNVLYADNGPEPFGETSIGALTALSHTLSVAYERLIADQKQARSA